MSYRGIWSPNDWRGLYYANARSGFSFNEGSGPVNFHWSWNNRELMGQRHFIYVAVRIPFYGWWRWHNGPGKLYRGLQRF